MVKIKKPTRKIKRKIFTGLACLVILLGLGYFLLSGGTLDIIAKFFSDGVSQNEIRGFVDALGIKGYATIAVLSMLQVVFTFVPAEPVQVIAGIGFGLWEGVLTCAIGMVIGNTILYFLYKIYGQKLTEFFEHDAEFDFASARTSNKIAFIVFLLYFLPAIPYGFICLFTASLNIRYPKYILLTTLGCIPSIFIGVGLGEIAMATSLIVSVVIFVVLLIVIILAIVYKKQLMAKVNEYVRRKKNSVKRANGLFLWVLNLAGKVIFDRKINLELKNNVGRIKGPAIVLCNHGSFTDFVYVVRFLYKEKPHIVSARLYFYHRFLGKLLLRLGCLPKSMFVTDLENVKGCVKVLSVGDILVIMPEARLSTVGKFEDIQAGTYGFIKKLSCDVYNIHFNGAYLTNPKWGDKIRRGGLIEGELNPLLTRDEIKAMDIDELKKRIDEAVYYDEFKWLEGKPDLHFAHKTLSEGLENILYICPECGARASFTTKGMNLTCESCGYHAELDDRYAFLDKKPFENFSEWYFWQREVLKKEILENEEFCLSSKVELRHSSKTGNKLTRIAGYGECTLDKSGLRYKGIEDGVEIDKFFPLSDIYRLLFGAGEDFEIYEGKDIWYFVPENKRSCVAWYVVSGLLKEIYDSEGI